MIAYIGYAKYGTRAVLDSRMKEVVISGLRHTNRPDIPFETIQAIQLVDAEIKNACDAGSWHAFQVNLVLVVAENTSIA